MASSLCAHCFYNATCLLLHLTTTSLEYFLIPRAASLRNVPALPGCAAKLDTEISGKILVIPDGWRQSCSWWWMTSGLDRVVWWAGDNRHREIVAKNQTADGIEYGITLSSASNAQGTNNFLLDHY